MLLGGLAALAAGTSYQAFGYQIKCVGQETCAWTSWWEVIYLMFQQVSMDAMLVAIAVFTSTTWIGPRKATVHRATASENEPSIVSTTSRALSASRQQRRCNGRPCSRR